MYMREGKTFFVQCKIKNENNGREIQNKFIVIEIDFNMNIFLYKLLKRHLYEKFVHKNVDEIDGRTV